MTSYEQARTISALECAERYTNEKLIPKGKKVWCCCPFHSEKTPSCAFFPDTGTFYCWGCEEGGDSTQFVSKLFGVNRYDASIKICDDFGLKYDAEDQPRNKPISPKQKIRNEALRESALFAINVWNGKMRWFKDRINEFAPGDPDRDLFEAEANKAYAIVQELTDYLKSNNAEALNTKLLELQGEIDDLYERLKLFDETCGTSYLKPELRGSDKAMKPKTESDQVHEDFSVYIESCRKAFRGSAGEAYLIKRGITAETADRFRIGYDRYKNAIVIPYPQENYYVLRYLNPGVKKKYHNPTGIPKLLFNSPALKAKKLFVVEGQIDAITIMQCGGEACATGGSGITKLADAEITGEVIIFADNDEPGERKANEIKELLTKKGIPFKIVRPCEGCKDVNEMLQKDPEALQRMITELVKKEVVV